MNSLAGAVGEGLGAMGSAAGDLEAEVALVRVVKVAAARVAVTWAGGHNPLPKLL